MASFRGRARVAMGGTGDAGLEARVLVADGFVQVTRDDPAGSLLLRLPTTEVEVAGADAGDCELRTGDARLVLRFGNRPQATWFTAAVRQGPAVRLAGRVRSLGRRRASD